MAQIDRYRAIIVSLLNDMAETIAPTPDVEHVVIADHERDQYLLLFVGWSKGRRLLELALYLRIRDGKVWLEANYGPDRVAEMLIDAGIPRNHIVLGFQPPELRHLTEYATA
jgi:XisI protein